jgi:hypothetical protein
MTKPNDVTIFSVANSLDGWSVINPGIDTNPCYSSSLMTNIQRMTCVRIMSLNKFIFNLVDTAKNIPLSLNIPTHCIFPIKRLINLEVFIMCIPIGIIIDHVSI